MNLPERLAAFRNLGEYLLSMPASEKKALASRAIQENGWFTEPSVALALQGLRVLLEPALLEKWSGSYAIDKAPSRLVGVAMAGNIPMVGFHDFLCVLIAGHKLLYKPSSRDTVLLDFVGKKLIEIEPRFAGHIARSERLNGADAVIATGSDNTSRYFEYYFRNIPHILRKNRVSCAVIQGDEPDEEIVRLGTDIFSYYGLGCRNVAAMFVPREYPLKEFLSQLDRFSGVLENHKYANNYTYQKTLMMLTRERFLDSGFILLRESEVIVSPVSVVHYCVYDDLADLKGRVAAQRGKLQVVVSAGGWFEGSIPFGTSQVPRVDDYADGVDTMQFLTSLK